MPTKTIIVTLSINPNDSSRASVSYNPTHEVVQGDSVVFSVQGNSEVFTVTFPEGSPFVSSVSAITVGGTTLAEQSSRPETVARVPMAHYRFWAAPARSPASASPGTETGDIEVVPESGGCDPFPTGEEAGMCIVAPGVGDTK